MEQLIWPFLIVGLLLMSGFFSGSETALFSLSPSKVRALRSGSDVKKRLIAKLLEKPRDLLVTVFMLNTLVNILLQNVTSAGVGEEGGWGAKVVAPFLLLLIFGEIIPKYIGLIKNVSYAAATAPLINLFQKFLGPLRDLTVKVTLFFTNILFFYLKKEENISHEEMKHVLKKSEEHGVLHPDESELVRGYLNLQDIIVKEAMRPREEILFFEIGQPITKLRHLFTEKEVSRLPVCEGDLQHVVGIISAADFFVHQEELSLNPMKLRSLLSKPIFIPESSPVRVFLKRLDTMDHELAMVVDEYGGVSGLITYEDMVEIVIGEIRDQRDIENLYSRPSPNEILASGKLELLEFNEIFDCNLESPNNMVTMGGWLTERYGSIPKSGTSLEYEGFQFRILNSTQTLIKKIYVRKL